MENAAGLDAAGVVIAIKGNEGSIHRAKETRYNAGNAVSHGLPYASAIAAITTNPARIFGMAGDFGALAPGAAGDVVIWSGDPLEPLSHRDERLRQRCRTADGNPPDPAGPPLHDRRHPGQRHAGGLRKLSHDMGPGMTSGPIIYIDADACPVKDEVYRVADRYGLKVFVVSNTWINTPRASLDRTGGGRCRARRRRRLDRRAGRAGRHRRHRRHPAGRPLPEGRGPGAQVQRPAVHAGLDRLGPGRADGRRASAVDGRGHVRPAAVRTARPLQTSCRLWIRPSCGRNGSSR